VAPHAEALPVARSRAASGDWPRTTRILPWLAALLVVMIYTVPIDSVALGIPLPFDPRPDRFLLLGCFVAWLLVLAVEEPVRGARVAYRVGVFDTLLVLFAIAAVASVALNLPVLEKLDEANTAAKQLILLLSYVAFYVFVAGVLRPSEVRGFVRLVVALGALAALLTVVEFLTRENLFYLLAKELAPPGTQVPADAGVIVAGGRPDVTGPGRHGLAVSAMLAMTLPFALAGAAFADARRARLFFGVAGVIILAGCLATVRRSGVVLPFVAVSVLLALGGRRMVPAVALTVAVLALVPVLAPGAFHELALQFSGANVQTQRSIEGRTSDYSAVLPDLRAHALIGRGYGSYIARRYRFLDNQYILLTIETGFVGLVLYLATVIAAAVRAVRLGLSRRRPAAWIGLAGAGSILAYLVANVLFDALAFPQAPYVFLLVVALVSVVRQATDAEEGGV
jgi:O-antigen ligase